VKTTCVGDIPRMNGGSGGILPRNFLKFEAGKCHFLHSEHPKNKIIINNNLSLLSGRKT
jgi:hypothetical protein